MTEKCTIILLPFVSFLSLWAKDWNINTLHGSWMDVFCQKIPQKIDMRRVDTY